MKSIEGRGDSQRLTSRQVTAIRRAEELAVSIDPNTAKKLFRRTKLTYGGMVQILLSGDEGSQAVARSAVKQVIHRVIPEKERKRAISKKWETWGSAMLKGDMTPEEFSAHQAEVARARHRKIKEGAGVPINTSGIVEGLGRTRWTEDEIKLLGILVQSFEFQHHGKNPLIYGAPDWKKIAGFINRIVHKDESIRSAKGASEFYKSHKPK